MDDPLVVSPEIPTRRYSADSWNSLAEQFSNRFGSCFQTGEAIRQQHGHTTTWIANQPPDGVVFASQADDVVFAVKACAQHNIPIVPFGAGSSLEGHVNAAEGGISLDLSRMSNIKAVHAEDFTCTVEPGVTRMQLNNHLRDQGLFFPIDPGADASLGGMASTRASGTNAVRYGTMKDVVLGVEAVLANGEMIHTGTRARKSAAGYDLTSLLVGAEGTLGVLTELTLKLFGIPEATASLAATFDSIENAAKAVIDTIQYGIPVARIELLDPLTVKAVNTYSDLRFEEKPLLLIEFHGTELSVAEQSALFSELATEHGGEVSPSANSPEERSKLWQARHDAYWASLQLRPGAQGVTTDTCVPISELASCIAKAQQEAERQGLLAPIVGHVGDGNFHVLLLIDLNDDKEVDTARGYVSWLSDMAISVGGTCTGEHGIGQGKQDYLRKELGGAVDAMVSIKQALDPQNLMNPGKIMTV
ncbi:MAG: FAD-linked oxidase C-terminal domain-containing protein [Pseudomonadota bacterium]